METKTEFWIFVRKSVEPAPADARILLWRYAWFGAPATINRAPHAKRVFFTGEATNLIERATVSGAHEEGVRAAKDVSYLLK
ncbi:MAG: hypothetical protein AAGF53_05345 [Pseudomonadota bacterium]